MRKWAAAASVVGRFSYCLLYAVYCLLFRDRACDQCGQATKGMWGMSWRQEAMKGVEDCDKPGGVVKRALIPGYPNERALNP
jgi:hypothetical protein